MAGQKPTIAELVEQFAISQNQISSIVHTLADECRARQNELEKAVIIITEQKKIIDIYKEKYGPIDRPNEPGKDEKKEIAFPKNKGGSNDKKTT